MKTRELKPKKPIYEDDLCLSGKKRPCLVFQDCCLSHHHISSLMYLKIIHVEKANIIVNFFLQKVMSVIQKYIKMYKTTTNKYHNISKHEEPQICKCLNVSCQFSSLLSALLPALTKIIVLSSNMIFTWSAIDQTFLTLSRIPS